jgi:hypothetical protein
VSYQNASGYPVQKAVQSVANALIYPDEYWKWIKSEPAYQNHKERVEQARKDVNRKTIPDDSSMMYAAAYLAVKQELRATNIKK